MSPKEQQTIFCCCCCCCCSCSFVFCLSLSLEPMYGVETPEFVVCITCQFQYNLVEQWILASVKVCSTCNSIVVWIDSSGLPFLARWKRLCIFNSFFFFSSVCLFMQLIWAFALFSLSIGGKKAFNLTSQTKQ